MASDARLADRACPGCGFCPDEIGTDDAAVALGSLPQRWWQLFDLAKDPYGLRDLWPDRRDVAAPLERELLGWMAKDRLRWLDAHDRLVARIER